MKYIIFISIISIFLYGDTYKQGEILYIQKGCNGCHGIAGKGLHDYPRLTYLNQAYLKKKIEDYQNQRIKTNRAPMMEPFARSITAKEAELITYYLENFHEDTNQERYEPEYQTWGDGGS